MQIRRKLPFARIGGLAASAVLFASLMGCTAAFQGLISTNTSKSSSSSQQQSSKTPQSVSVTPSSVVLTQGNQQQLSAVVSYTDGTHDTNVSWASSDNTVVSVNSTNGTLTGVAPGVASVVATSPLDSTVKAVVTVTVKPATSQDAFVVVTPSTASVSVHNTIQLSAYVQTSAGQTTPNFTWSSSNQSIALVSGTGLVTGIAPGTVSITATSEQDPTKNASVTVAVTQ